MILEVMMPGSPVKVNGIEGTILRVCIGDKNAVRYEVTWWDGRCRYVDWVDQIEVERSEKTAGMQIGFQG